MEPLKIYVVVLADAGRGLQAPTGIEIIIGHDQTCPYLLEQS